MAAPEGSSAATVSLEFERPLATVRALFFDVDLAVRQKIHRGTRLQWITPSSPPQPQAASKGAALPAEQRLRQTYRVLERLQSEEVVIGEGLGGAWEKRFLTGPN